MRIWSAPYSASGSAVLIWSLISPVSRPCLYPRHLVPQGPRRARLHAAVTRPSSTANSRPRAPSRRAQPSWAVVTRACPRPATSRAQRRRPLLVELGVEVVEERHRRRARPPPGTPRGWPGRGRAGGCAPARRTRTSPRRGRPRSAPPRRDGARPGCAPRALLARLAAASISPRSACSCAASPPARSPGATAIAYRSPAGREPGGRGSPAAAGRNTRGDAAAARPPRTAARPRPRGRRRGAAAPRCAAGARARTPAGPGGRRGHSAAACRSTYCRRSRIEPRTTLRRSVE